MAFGLLRCPYRHTFSSEYTAYVMRGSWNQLETTRYTCPKCKTTKLYLITNYDPTFTVTNLVSGTFGDVRYSRLANLLSFKEDSIRKLLVANNYVVSPDSNDSTVIYAHPAGNKVIFVIEEGRKTQNVIILSPEKDEIIAKVIEANKADKRARKTIAPPKPVLPTKYKDFLGEELTIGDWVAYATFNYTNLQVGRITKINEKSVSLSTGKRSKSISKNSAQIVKLSKERAVLLSLEM